jgi:hypothetical protein
MNTMNTTNNLRRVKAISKFLPMDGFYSVDAGRYNIALQGEYDRDLVKAAMDHKFKLREIDDAGFAVFIRGNIRLILE